MIVYCTNILLWISRLSGIRIFVNWAGRFDQSKLVFTRVRGEYAASRIHLSITAFNPSRIPRIIHDLTLHLRVGSTPYTLRLTDTNAGTYIENYRLPAHSISSFTCEASPGNHTTTDILTIHFTYLDEHNFRHHVWIDAPGRFQLPNNSPYAG
jgi:hypothetical protein